MQHHQHTKHMHHSLQPNISALETQTIVKQSCVVCPGIRAILFSAQQLQHSTGHKWPPTVIMIFRRVIMTIRNDRSDSLDKPQWLSFYQSGHVSRNILSWGGSAPTPNGTSPQNPCTLRVNRGTIPPSMCHNSYEKKPTYPYHEYKSMLNAGENVNLSQNDRNSLTLKFSSRKIPAHC